MIGSLHPELVNIIFSHSTATYLLLEIGVGSRPEAPDYDSSLWIANE
jgi:hypothetical protein